MCKGVFLVDTSCVFSPKTGKHTVIQSVVAQRGHDRRDVEGGNAEVWFHIHPPIPIHSFQCTSPFPMTCKDMAIEYREGMGWLFNDVRVGRIEL